MSTAKKLNLTNMNAHEIIAPAMISPFWDCVLSGGLALAVFLLMNMSLAKTTADAGVALFIFNISYVINFPHFLASYMMFYGDFRQEIGRNFRYFFAGIVVPIVLIGMMAEGFALSNPMMLGYSVVAMYFFVGWHYVKQTFGVMVVSNAYQKIFYNKPERFWLQLNMYAIWAVSFFNSNIGPSMYQQNGINYPSLNLSIYPVYVSYAVLAVAAFANLVMHVRKYIREGVIPTPAAIAGYFAIYAFLLPILSHPIYGLIVPAFHSLQYLLFVYTFRRNKVEASIQKNELPHQIRRRRVFGLGGFFVGAVVLGALAFSIIPGAMDMTDWMNRGLFGATPFVFAFTVFINVHHYFIDNVMWKGNNPEMRAYLFPSR